MLGLETLAAHMARHGLALLQIATDSDTSAATSVTVPDDATGKEIHVILEVQDDSEIVPLYDYRRVIVTVAK